eukprot:3618465-Pyramimonas_sp.AAC.1
MTTFRRSQPPPARTARSRSGPRGASPRRTHQQPSKVATVSQIAAPQGWRGLIWVRASRHCAGPPSRPRKRRQFHRSQPPRDGEVLFGSA